MKRLLIILVLMLVPSTAAATDIYVAQASAGGNTGANCANARAASSLVSGDWAAGNIIHLCGTLTAGVSPINSGAVGNPITIKFEPSATITVVGCGTLGCIGLNGKSNITIDGGTPCGYVAGVDTPCNGQITATGIGTGLANTDSDGIYARGGGSNIIIKNVAINNMYVRNSVTDESASGNYHCVWTDATNIHVLNIICHDAMSGIKAENGNNNSEYNNMEVYNVNWSTFLSGPGTNTPNGVTQILIHDNDFYDWQNWDDSVGNLYHHDGCFAAGNNNLANGISFIYCYNNYLRGTVSDPTNCAVASGSCMTAHVYMNDGNHFFAFNNRIQLSVNGQFVNNGFITYQTFGTLDANDAIWNNTVQGTNGAGGYCISVRGDASVDVRNNVMSNCNQLFNATTSPATTLTFLDFNTYQRSSLTNAWQCGSNTSNTLVAWQSVTPNGATCNASADTHSQAQTGSLNLGATLRPQPGSSLLAFGTNLTGVGPTALNSDALGNPRPAAGNWDAGALNGQSSSSSIIYFPGPAF